MSQPAPTRRQPPRARPGVSATARLFRSLPPGAPPDWQRAASDAITAGARIDSPLPRQNGETALMHAAAIGRLDVAVWLLDHGANPNARDRNGRTPLIHAIRGAYLDSQSLERATLLTERGADLDARNHADWTPWDMPCGRGTPKRPTGCWTMTQIRSVPEARTGKTSLRAVDLT